MSAGGSGAGPVVLVLNPAARRAGPTARAALVRALAAAGDLEIVTTRAGDDATALAARARADGASAIVAAGGDGTMGQVAAALTGGGPPMLPFPLGNANVFARSLGWPADPVRAAAVAGRALAGGRRTRTVVPWRVDADGATTLALMNLGAGLDGHVVEWIERRQGLKQRAGQLGFAAGAMVAARAASGRRLAVVADGASGPSGHSLIAALGSPWTWFGSRRIDPLPGARHDGTLHWLVVDGSPVPAIWRALRPADARADEYRGTARERLEITSVEPMPVQADGEPLGRARRVRTRPAEPLAVVCPD